MAGAAGRLTSMDTGPRPVHPSTVQTPERTMSRLMFLAACLALAGCGDPRPSTGLSFGVGAGGVVASPELGVRTGGAAVTVNP